MAHPFAGQAQASQKRRLRALGASAGKAHGSSSMYKKRSYPKKNAGSSTPMTISGGSSRPRADRLASGGAVGRKRRGHSTTNIIISHAGGQGGTGGGAGGATAPVRPAMPVPVPRPVPVPVGAAPAGPGPAGPAALPPRPPMAAPAGPPVGAGPPPGMAPPGAVRPPGMKAGGAVRKAAKGGFLRDAPGKSYPGFPHSPTTKTSSAVSAHKKGGVVGGFKQGGVAKRQAGGPAPGPVSASIPAQVSAIGQAVPAIAPAALGMMDKLGATGGGGAPSSGGGVGSGTIGGDTDVTIGRSGIGPEQRRSLSPPVGPGLMRKRGGAVRRAEGGDTPPPVEPVISDQVVAGTGAGGMGPDSGESDVGRKKYSDTPRLGGDYERGGAVKKRQFGGGAGAMGSSFGQTQPQQQQGGLLGPGPGRGPSPAVQGPPTISGRAARPAMPLTVPQPPTLGARLQRPAPGMTVGYKKGGEVHDDEAQDRKLIKKMISEEDKSEKGMKRGGSVKKYRDWGKGQTKTTGGSMSPRLNPGEKYRQQGAGYADGGAVHGAGSAVGRLARNKAR